MLIETAKLQTADLVVMVDGLNYNIVKLKGGTEVTLISHQSTVKQKKINPQKLLTPSVDSCLNR